MLNFQIDPVSSHSSGQFNLDHLAPCLSASGNKGWLVFLLRRRVPSFGNKNSNRLYYPCSKSNQSHNTDLLYVKQFNFYYR